MHKTKKKYFIISISALLLAALILYTVWGNSALELNHYTISSKTLLSNFDGFRIAHISDLHNTDLGNQNKKLIFMLSDSKPDIIAITGDLIDSRNTNIEIALEFVKEAVKIAPCYYVTGNHESRISNYDDLKEGLEKLGVIVLEDEKEIIEKNGEKIAIFGIDDPSFHGKKQSANEKSIVQEKLEELFKNENSFSILLSHRPEFFEVYVENDINLVLCGHAHGGQFRLPFLGGIAAPNQGLFPKFDSGMFTENSTNMIVSRGIGNSIIPFRFNNRPELILIEFKSI